MTRVYECTATAVQGAGPFAERLQRAFRAYLDIVAQRGVLFAILQANLTGKRLEKAARRSAPGCLDCGGRARMRLAASLAAMVAWMVLNGAGAPLVGLDRLGARDR